jgi:hypothetical protein
MAKPQLLLCLLVVSAALLLVGKYACRALDLWYVHPYAAL